MIKEYDKTRYCYFPVYVMTVGFGLAIQYSWHKYGGKYLYSNTFQSTSATIDVQPNKCHDLYVVGFITLNYFNKWKLQYEHNQHYIDGALCSEIFLIASKESIIVPAACRRTQTKLCDHDLDCYIRVFNISATVGDVASIAFDLNSLQNQGL